MTIQLLLSQVCWNPHLDGIVRCSWPAGFPLIQQPYTNRTPSEIDCTHLWPGRRCTGDCPSLFLQFSAFWPAWVFFSTITTLCEAGMNWFWSFRTCIKLSDQSTEPHGRRFFLTCLIHYHLCRMLTTILTVDPLWLSTDEERRKRIDINSRPTSLHSTRCKKKNQSVHLFKDPRWHNKYTFKKCNGCNYILIFKLQFTSIPWCLHTDTEIRGGWKHRDFRIFGSNVTHFFIG